ncbi:hypothetical protein GCM10027346_14730 [Hymenobacter seoulensis]
MADSNSCFVKFVRVIAVISSCVRNEIISLNSFGCLMKIFTTAGGRNKAEYDEKKISFAVSINSKNRVARVNVGS